MNATFAQYLIKCGVTPVRIESELRGSSSRPGHDRRIKAFCRRFRIMQDDLLALADRWGIPI